jgi:hypothetical protein
VGENGQRRARVMDNRGYTLQLKPTFMMHPAEMAPGLAPDLVFYLKLQREPTL